MLSLYLKSIVIYWIILFAAMKIAKSNLKSQNINIKDYVKSTDEHSKLSLLLISAVPVYRFGILLAALFLCVSSKEMLDKVFKKEGEE